MPYTTKVVFDPNVAREIELLPEMQEALHLDAVRMSAVARGLAPKRTGRGAASIYGSQDPTDDTGQAVSWAQAAYYMVFAEHGHQSYPGKHFLQRTMDTYVHH